MTDTLRIQPAPGFADVQGSRILFTPPGAFSSLPLIPTGTLWRAEPLSDGRALLCDAQGECWGTFADASVCARTAERLSR